MGLVAGDVGGTSGSPRWSWTIPGDETGTSPECSRPKLLVSGTAPCLSRRNFFSVQRQSTLRSTYMLGTLLSGTPAGLIRAVFRRPYGQMGPTAEICLCHDGNGSSLTNNRTMNTNTTLTQKQGLDFARPQQSPTNIEDPMTLCQLPRRLELSPLPPRPQTLKRRTKIKLGGLAECREIKFSSTLPTSLISTLKVVHNTART